LIAVGNKLQRESTFTALQLQKSFID